MLLESKEETTTKHIKTIYVYLDEPTNVLNTIPKSQQQTQQKQKNTNTKTKTTHN